MAFVEIRDLRVFYGTLEAVHGINLDIDEKSITAILGSNGAGKTTIINAISGMLRRTGSVVFNGRPLSAKPDRVVRSGVVQIPEGRRIYPGLTVEENLRLGAFTVRSGHETLRLMEEQYQVFPILKDRKNQDAGTLSGGEQQMLAIARGLMSKPKLLMLDEPSLGLAPIIVNDVFHIIENIHAHGITVLLVEQNAKKSLSVCKNAYVIENGSIILSGTGRELLNNEQIANAYLGASRMEGV
jgi:branched-chain amino acid transport system ATP-binding protein